MTDEIEPRHMNLSEDGLQRRFVMRNVLIAETRRVSRCRRYRRGALRIAAVGLALSAGIWAATIRPVRRAVTTEESPVKTAATPSGSIDKAVPLAVDPVTIVIVKAGGGSGRIEQSRERLDPAEVAIGDEELLNLLASSGRPTGLARIGGVTILTAAVTDVQIQSNQRDAEKSAS